MNEITKIHLGRQPFIISVEAHTALRAYLDAIAAQVGTKNDVLKEVELRMAELLNERGVKGDKVILEEDVTFLKEQLGEPRDFKEDGDEPEATAHTAEDASAPKRLYRDTDNGMIAGVSSGLAAYLGIDAVIVRLIFVVITLMAGWGILLYIILWLIVPEAKTTSERLQMRGKAVTVDSLKEIVDRADVPGAGRRMQKYVGPAAERIGRIVLAIVGIGFIIFGAMTFFGGMVSGLYSVLYRQDIFQGTSFALSAGDYAFIGSAVAITAVVGLFAVLIGSALVRRKWQLPGWVTAGLLGIFFVAVTAATVLAPAFVDKLKDYYAAARHTQTRQLASFSDLKIVGSDSQRVRYDYIPSDAYSVELHYLGDAKYSDIKTEIEGTTLVVDARAYDDNTGCRTVCLVPVHDMQLIIHAPQLKTIKTQGENVTLVVPQSLRQESVVLEAVDHSWITLSKISASSAVVVDNRGMESPRVTLSGIQPSSNVDVVTVQSDSVSLHGLAALSVESDTQCVPSSGTVSNPIVWLDHIPEHVTVNGKVIMNLSELARGNEFIDKKDSLSCIGVSS